MQSTLEIAERLEENPVDKPLRTPNKNLDAL